MNYNKLYDQILALIDEECDNQGNIANILSYGSSLQQNIESKDKEINKDKEKELTKEQRQKELGTN